MTLPTELRVALVREVPEASLGALVHPAWASAFPWLVQGTTTRGAPPRERDFGLFGGGAPEAVRRSWDDLIASTGVGAAVHAKQVHAAEVRVHEGGGSGLVLAGPCDGHVTGTAGVLLAVTTADCVPIFVVDPEERVVAMLHAGWRGVALGVLERGLAALADRAGSEPSRLHLHLGPAICGDCYEVGPEVFSALALPVPDTACLLDVRSVLAARALARGVDARRLTVSEHCTRCTGSGLYSHRAGDRGRQVGFIGVRRS